MQFIWLFQWHAKLSYFSDWSPIIRLGALDCAQDVNTAVCRQYDILGYPSLKFFPPKASQHDPGQLREARTQEVPHIMQDIVAYIKKLSTNATFASFWSEREWPNFRLVT